MSSIITGNLQLQLGEFNFNCKLDLKNEITGILGHSGCGKTTLLRCIAGLEKHVSGELSVNNTLWQNSHKQFFLKPHKRSIAYVFQDSRLFTNLTIAENLRYSTTRKPLNNTNTKFNEIVTLLNLKALLERNPENLSGGEKQRVAIGRALMSEPELLLMDEPLASLDDKRKKDILPYIEKLHSQFSIPIIYVTHSLSEISSLSDSLILMENGQITAQGTTADLLTDLDHPLADLTDATTVIKGTVKKHNPIYNLLTIQSDVGELLVPGIAIKKDSKLRLTLKAKDLSLCLEKPNNSSIINILQATIKKIDKSHDCHVNVRLQINNSYLLSRISHLSLYNLKLKEGLSVYVQIKGIAMKELH